MIVDFLLNDLNSGRVTGTFSCIDFMRKIPLLTLLGDCILSRSTLMYILNDEVRVTCVGGV